MDVVDYKKLLVLSLTKLSESPCSVCKNMLECKKEKCPDYCCGDTAVVDGKTVKWKWTCMDTDFGDCGYFENTPCNGCIQNNFRGFELVDDFSLIYDFLNNL